MIQRRSKKLRSSRQRARAHAIAVVSKPQTESVSDSTTGVASDYLRYLTDILAREPGVPIVLLSRVSSRQQERNGNHLDDLANLRTEVEKFGGKIVGEFGGFEHGWATWPSGRPHFMVAVAAAKKHGAVILATSSNRFLRHRDYKRTRALPTVADYQALLKLADGVRLVTWLHPDTPETHAAAGEESTRGNATKRGLSASKTTVRNAKTERRRKNLREALLLHKIGVPVREIARDLKIPHKTVDYWTSRFRCDFWHIGCDHYTEHLSK